MNKKVLLGIALIIILLVVLYYYGKKSEKFSATQIGSYHWQDGKMVSTKPSVGSYELGQANYRLNNSSAPMKNMAAYERATGYQDDRTFEGFQDVDSLLTKISRSEEKAGGLPSQADYEGFNTTPYFSEASQKPGLQNVPTVIQPGTDVGLTGRTDKSMGGISSLEDIGRYLNTGPPVINKYVNSTFKKQSHYRPIHADDPMIDNVLNS